MQNISSSSSLSTSSLSKSIFVQDGHRPSNHCIQMATWPQAQLKTATGFKHGHGEVFCASASASSADASSASIVRSAWATLGNRGEIQNEIGPLPRARVVPIQSPRGATGFLQQAATRHGCHWPSSTSGHRPLQPQAFHNHAAAGHFGHRPSMRPHAMYRGRTGTQLDKTAVDRSLVTGVGLKASAKKDEVSLPQTGSFFVGMKNAAEQQAIPLLIDLMSARGSAKNIEAFGSDGCPSELWKYLSCLSMVVIFRIFPLCASLRWRTVAMSIVRIHPEGRRN